MTKSNDSKNEKFNEYEAMTMYFAKVFVTTQGTMRSTAEECHSSKSTVHLRLREFAKLGTEDGTDLSSQVKRLIKKNKSERHMRGGNSTKKKFMELKK